MRPVIFKEVDGQRQMGEALIETHLEYIKVFEVNSESAKVLVVVINKMISGNGYVDSGRAGTFRYLRQQEGKWIIDTTKPEEVIWDDMGVPDGATWPPYH
jgi:hypothetical protein